LPRWCSTLADLVARGDKARDAAIDKTLKLIEDNGLADDPFGRER
jgi:hypothetical protein